MQRLIIVFDLDDTLYDEINFVKSGFSAVAMQCDARNPTPYYDYMLSIFEQQGSGKVFNRLIEYFKLNISISELIHTYRYHIPNIVLPPESVNLLNFLKNDSLALITDGTYQTQINKYHQLKLEAYIDFPIFSAQFNTSKPDEALFKKVTEKFPNQQYLYIADNPKKDFQAPHTLNWHTIRFKNPNGIYKNIKNNAQYEVYSREEMLETILSIRNNIH